MPTVHRSDQTRFGRQADACADVLAELLERYERRPRAITVSFRNLVEWLSGGERATHMIHPYPAKLLPQIAHLFAANSLLSAPGDTVLDPFCGSGTVLLEAALASRHSIGADANPLARLIAQVKVRRVAPDLLRRATARLFRRIPDRAEPPDVVNRDYWFYPHVVAQLSRLTDAIARTRDPDLRAFFYVCFSNCVRRVSLADPRLAVPVRLRRDQYERDHWLHGPTQKRLRRLRRQNVIDIFRDVVEANIARMTAYVAATSESTNADVVCSDARALRNDAAPSSDNQPVPANSIDLIITSPPYAGAQKYIRSSSLSLGWLRLAAPEELRSLEDKSIGREHFVKIAYAEFLDSGIEAANRSLRRIRRQNALRAHIAAAYLLEMADALAEMSRVLKPGGHLVLVMANNRVCGEEFHTQEFLCELALRQGLQLRLRLVDEITSRGLMTRRNTTAGLIERESVFLFQKPIQ